MFAPILALVAVALDVPIASFDGVKATELQFKTVNDPVMGGQSTSSFHVEKNVGVWEGEVKIVPFLKAPGFCTLQAQDQTFPTLHGTSGIAVRVAATEGLKQFRVMVGSNTAGRGMFNRMQYTAEITASAEMAEQFVPWSAFSCSWHGKNMDWFCPKIYHQLDQVTSVGIGTHYPLDAPTAFKLEIESIVAKNGEGKKPCPFKTAVDAAKELYATDEARSAIAAVEDLYYKMEKKVEKFTETSIEDKVNFAVQRFAHHGDHHHHQHHHHMMGKKPCPFKKAVDAAKAMHATDEAQKAIAAVEDLYELEKKKVDGVVASAQKNIFV